MNPSDAKKLARKPTKNSRVGVLPPAYLIFLKEIKARIHEAQVRASFAANDELIRLYWDIGNAIDLRQKREGWGAAVIPRLARDIHNELSDLKGFSERNLKRMLAFAREYPALELKVPHSVALSHGENKASFVPQAVAQISGKVKSLDAAALSLRINLQQLVTRIPWGHHVILIGKIKEFSTRFWYMNQTIEYGWSRSVLELQIKGRAHTRAGKLVHNFKNVLPAAQSDLAQQTLKDPYIFDFLTLEEPFHEREMETQLIRHLEKFLLELGQGFAFVGRQYHLEVSKEDFYIDLLFYHLKLRAYVVIELKKGSFKAEYAGKMNFYCNVVDDKLRQSADNPTIGLILCQDKNRVVAEYALKGVRKAIGVSEYQLSRALPGHLKSSLPSIAEIEKELSGAPRLKERRIAAQKKSGRGS